MNLKFAFIFKIISSFICSAGLLFQLTELFSEYLTGKTVVNVKVKKEIYDNFPAFTICFPRIFSLEAFAKHFEDYKQDYEIYKNMVDEIEYYDDTDEAKEKEERYEHYQSNLSSIYRKTDLIYENKTLRNNNLYDFIIDNLSIPHIYNRPEGISKSISVTVHGNLKGK